MALRAAKRATIKAAHRTGAAQEELLRGIEIFAGPLRGIAGVEGKRWRELLQPGDRHAIFAVASLRVRSHGIEPLRERIWKGALAIRSGQTEIRDAARITLIAGERANPDV